MHECVYKNVQWLLFPVRYIKNEKKIICRMTQ